MKPSADITPAMQRAIGALLENATRDQAAKASGISARTLRRYMADELFLSALARQRTRVLANVGTVLAANAGQVASMLAAIARGTATANPARVSAGRCVLEFALSFESATTTTARLDELAAEVGKLRALVKEPEPWS